MGWVYVASLTEIPARGARVLQLPDVVIGVFRTSDDRVFALHDRCPHRAGPLSQGIVHGTCVTCPLHDWVIDLATGEAQAPDEGRTKTYPVRVDGDAVHVDTEQANIPGTSAHVTPAVMT
jgi:nitrite reductase (NADH) small subunit